MKLMLLAALASLTAQAQELTPQQQRGRIVYTEGKGGATVGGKALPAKLLPCASCHGENGRGQREGGTGVADITPPVLARATIVGERSRPAYAPAALRRAIAAGVDSAGQPLDRAMPRYQLSKHDVGDLLAYLAILDKVMPIGVSADAVRINVAGAASLTAPAQTTYGRRIVLQHDSAEGALLTIAARTTSATREEQIAAMRDYAATLNADAMLLADDCRALHAGSATPLVLMTSDAAAHCDLGDITSVPGRKIIVAATAPPDGDAEAQAQLDLVAATLARMGRDFTRKSFLEAYQSAERLRASKPRVWLMTLDVRKQALLAEPGLWRVP